MIVKDDGKAAPLTSGNMPTVSIGISDKPQGQQMVLDILVNKLYTDKPAAILREYACNAADANVEAGKGDVPVDVRLPNKLDPTLAIRDYGAGMDEQQIQETFCKLGESTKRLSNDFTGMLGIGSKAGFAYGDQFMITSFSKGHKTIYSAYRDKGFKLSLLFSEPTTEPEGLEIKVPIREADFEVMRSTAERVFRYFKVRPNVTGGKIEWADRTHEFSGTGWRFLGKRQQSVAIMGNVGYSLDINALDISGTSVLGTQLAASENILIGLGIELDFNIGDLEVASNREGLQYDDATKAALRAKLLVVINEIGDTMTGKIATAKTMWDAKLAFHTLFDELGSDQSQQLRRVIGKKIMWGGKPVESSLVNMEVTAMDTDVKVSRWNKCGLTRAGAVRLYEWGPVHSVEASPSVALVVNDLASRKLSPARLRGLFSTHQYLSDVIVFTFMTAKAEGAFIKARGLTGAPFLKLSTIPPQVIPRVAGTGGAPSAHRSKHTSRVFKLIEPTADAIRANGRVKSLWWETENLDLKKDGGVYVEIDMFNAVNPYCPPSCLLENTKLMKAAGLISGVVYGFKSDRIAKLGPKWVSLKDHAQKQWDALVRKDKNLLQEIADYAAAWAYSPLIQGDHAALFPRNTSIRRLFDMQKKLKNPRSEKVAKMIKDSNINQYITIPTLPKPPINFQAMTDKVLEDYPMFKLAGEWQLRQLRVASQIQPLADYVKMVSRRK